MSASFLLPLCLAVASVLGPPTLPEEQPAPVEQPPAGAPSAEAPQNDAPADTAELAPPQLAPPRSSLPAGLEPVANPFDRAPESDPAPAPEGGPEAQPEGSSTTTTPPPAPVQPAPPPRRSIVDLRDPFDQPPPRVRSTSRAAGQRMVLPDLKDPFAPGVRRVRSRKLSQGGLRDIRDPFREGARLGGPRPPCARTTEDGTVVQTPGAEPQQRPNCTPAAIDLRDPFDDR